MVYKGYTLKEIEKALQVFDETHNYSEVERRTGMGRRTVKRYVEQRNTLAENQNPEITEKYKSTIDRFEEATNQLFGDMANWRKAGDRANYLKAYRAITQGVKTLQKVKGTEPEEEEVELTVVIGRERLASIPRSTVSE